MEQTRYRRCGWSWVLMQSVNGNWQEAATVHGPLPGARQSNNRAEITAFLDCLQSTVGDLVFYTDSEILCKGWHSR
eukprot:7853306-Pyramimonas_sp.AAC.1